MGKKNELQWVNEGVFPKLTQNPEVNYKQNALFVAKIAIVMNLRTIIMGG